MKWISISLLVFFFTTKEYAQTERECRNYFAEAEHYFELKQYSKVLPFVQKIDNCPQRYFIHDDPDYNFVAGCSFWFSDTSKLKAIPFLEKYREKSSEEIEVIIWLANLYHMNYQYVKAKEKYIEYKEVIRNDSRLDPVFKLKLMKELDRSILSCEYAKMLSIYPSKVIIENLGDSINTQFPEYASVINKTESEIFFTRKSPENVGKKLSNKGEYYEDIYKSNITEGSLFQNDTSVHSGFVDITKPIKLTKAVNIGEPVNTDMHDAAIQLSHNDQFLYIYKKNHVWLSEIDSTGKLSTPHPITELNSILNLGNYEPSVSINKAEDIIYFASERLGGYGGLDLYSSKKVNGVWQTAVNLGPTINTEHDEDSPYIDPDNKTLYFSSKGHSSMGGYDIFKTILIDTSWMHPSNMGFPINSNSDDIFFIMPDKYNRAYFSSNRNGGKGNMDVYRISFIDERQNFAEIRGKVKKGDKLINAKSKLTVMDNINNEIVSEFQSDSITGDYHILMDHDNKYIVKVETDGFRAYKRNFNIPKQKDYYSFYQEIHHIHLKDKNGNIIGHLVNLYTLNPDDADLNTIFESEAYLYITKDSLLKLLEEDSLLFKEYSEKTKLFFLNLNSESITDQSALDLASLKLLMAKKRQESYVQNSNYTPTESEKEINITFYFPFNEYQLTKEQTDSLYRVFNKLFKQKKIPLIKIEGHTDGKGTVNYNKELSQKRAKSAERVIKLAHPALLTLNLIASGYSKPLAKELTEDGKDDEAGRQKNRRVEITLIVGK